MVEYITYIFIIQHLRFIYTKASVAQSAARQSHNLKAVSSSLTRGSKTFLMILLMILTLKKLYPRYSNLYSKWWNILKLHFLANTNEQTGKYRISLIP